MFSLLLVLVSCGTYQVVTSSLKLLLLTVCAGAFVSMALFLSGRSLFDRQDQFLYYAGSAGPKCDHLTSKGPHPFC